jgi:sugar (pentulose or hexulose) kinase
MEGVVCDLRENLEIMTDMDLTPETIIASGGASKSKLWMQILADIFKCPVMISTQEEAACFGSALIAGIGVGAYKSYWEAAEFVKKPVRMFEPNEKNRTQYDDQFEKFKKLYHKMFIT